MPQFQSQDLDMQWIGTSLAFQWTEGNNNIIIMMIIIIGIKIKIQQHTPGMLHAYGHAISGLSLVGWWRKRQSKAYMYDRNSWAKCILAVQLLLYWLMHIIYNNYGLKYLVRERGLITFIYYETKLKYYNLAIASYIYICTYNKLCTYIKSAGGLYQKGMELRDCTVQYFLNK